MEMETITNIYETFCNKKGYSPDTRKCIEDAVANLFTQTTDVQTPGLLLGKVQSGKTRTFIGVIALAFDKGVDVCLVLTKGTKALALQTINRLKSEFFEFANGNECDDVTIFDVMTLPDYLTPYQRGKKIILVVKKQKDNLRKALEFFERYTDLKQKRVLIVDDEADQASVGYKRDVSQEDEVSINVLSEKINDLRSKVASCYFLQVTATPYSLYLQPKEIELNGSKYKPTRPTFTHLVPVPDNYIGGEFYFDDCNESTSLASYLRNDVPEREIEILNKKDERYISGILDTPNLTIFRRSIVSYIVSGAIRRIQEAPKNYKSSFIIHTNTAREKHEWQYRLCQALIAALAKCSETDFKLFSNLIKDSYDKIIMSVRSVTQTAPSLETVIGKIKTELQNGCIGTLKVNSDQEISTLLDNSTGQLRLDNPYNIFVGGQILDRGITIDRLIGFFYGRNPSKFQQDTVIQHSRMYGYRSQEDLAVTRFYTTTRIYNAMKRMHEFDSELREAFEQKKQDRVVFLGKDNQGNIKPCAPSKILISQTTTLRPHKRFLPVGFQTKSKTNIFKKVEEIDAKITSLLDSQDQDKATIEAKVSYEILEMINETYEWDERYFNEEYRWDLEDFKAVIQKTSNDTLNPTLKGKIHILIRRDRDVARHKDNLISYSDAPDDGHYDLPYAKDLANEVPCLILIKQNGKEEKGWRGSPFWWPVLVVPRQTKSYIFTSELLP